MGIRIIEGIDQSGVMYHEIVLGRDYYQRHSDIIEWCRHQFGLSTSRWSHSNIFGHTFITFYDKKDMNWFMLKWM